MKKKHVISSTITSIEDKRLDIIWDSWRCVDEALSFLAPSLITTSSNRKRKWKLRKFNVEWKWCDLCKVFSFGNSRKYARFHQLRFIQRFLFVKYKKKVNKKRNKVMGTWIFFYMLDENEEHKKFQNIYFIHSASFTLFSLFFNIKIFHLNFQEVLWNLINVIQCLI